MPAELDLQPTTSPATPETDMGIFDRTDADDQPATTTPAAAPPADPNPTVAVVEPDAPEADPLSYESAPWANPECKACKGVGFNKKGAPCAACDRVAEKEGNPRIASFTIAVDDAGETVVTRIADEAEVYRIMLQVAAVATAEKTKPVAASVKARAAAKRDKFAQAAAVATEAATAAVEQPTVAPENPDNERIPTETVVMDADALPAATTAEPADVKPSKDKTSGKGRKGRSATGFIMVYGAVRRTKMKLVDLNEIFQRYAAELATAMGADSYFQLDRFKRRDQMASKAAEIAETIPSSSIVVVRADDPDIRPFATALEAFATNVIEGISS